MNDEHEDDRQEHENDAEACPGCGRMPGDGIAPVEICNHEDGCGYWREHGAE